MFEPQGLRERYARLVDWGGDGGMWVNYWTETAAKDGQGEDLSEEERRRLREERTEDNDRVLLESGVAPVPPPMETMHSSASSMASTTSSYATAHSELHGSWPGSPDSSLPIGPSSESSTQSNTSKQSEMEAAKNLAKALKEDKKDKKLHPKSRHFVVLPTGLGSILGGSKKWEKVTIAGVKDEVAAHCGLFIPDQNLDYDDFVYRVGGRVLEWCDRI